MVRAEALPNYPIEAFHRSGLVGSITASRNLNYIYVQNWKCGSSTVRRTLWAAEHEMGLAAAPSSTPQRPSPDAPFVSDPARWERVDQSFVFTIARNPYVRVLSAYLDKIQDGRDKRVWHKFATEHGIERPGLSFRQFLTIVAATPPARMDPHWRPQTCNLVPGLIPYDFIGSLENFEADLGHILSEIFPDRAVAIRDYKPHRTGASDRLAEFFGPAEIRLVREIYGRDFVDLGYDLDLGDTARHRAPVRCDPTFIRDWGRACRRMAERDYAQAESDFSALRTWIDGPYVEEQILHCRCEQKDTPRERVQESVSSLENAIRNGHEDWSAWKWYGRGLMRLGRIEDGLTALIKATELQVVGGRKDKRVDRLTWRLALLRASKGRLSEALATLGPSPRAAAASTIARPGWLRRTTVRVTAVAAALVGARFWHPDRNQGIPQSRPAARRPATGAQA